MAGRLSRRKLAMYVAEQLEKGVSIKKVLGELAAFLVDTRRTDEVELIVRDIEVELAAGGTVVANITTAHPLTEALKKDIQKLVDAKSLQVRETVDPGVLGGVLVDLPGKRFDGTIRRKLTALKAKQV